MSHDIAIIGAGPAGLSAALSGARAGLNISIFEEESIGGELVNRESIENFPGIPNASGPDLRSTIVEQLEEYDVSLKLARVEEVSAQNPFVLVTPDDEFLSSSVIVATGGFPRRLDATDESKYRGRGVFYCAKCDGPLYAGKLLAVSGGSDWALTDTLYLADHASEVILITADPELDAGQSLLERVQSHPRITVRTETEIQRVYGDEVLQGIEVTDSAGDTERLDQVEGLYVQRGIEFDPAFLGDTVSTTADDEIAVDARLETKTPGLFAAGDIREGSPRTIASAVGDGMTALHSARRFLDKG